MPNSSQRGRKKKLTAKNNSSDNSRKKKNTEDLENLETQNSPVNVVPKRRRIRRTKAEIEKLKQDKLEAEAQAEIDLYAESGHSSHDSHDLFNGDGGINFF